MNEIEERLEELEHLGLTRRMRLISGPQGPTRAAGGQAGAAALLQQLPRSRRPSARAGGRGRRGDALGRRRGRLATGVGLDDDPRPPRGALGGLQGNRGVRAVRLWIPRQPRRDRRAGRAPATRCSPTSSTTRRSSTAAGSRAPRSSCTATATSSTCEWSIARHGAARDAQARRVIVSDSVFSMDGDVAPLLEHRRAGTGLRRAHGRVDEAHAVGSLGPGRARSGRRGRPGGRGRRRDRARSARRSAPTARTRARARRSSASSSTPRAR